MTETWAVLVRQALAVWVVIKGNWLMAWEQAVSYPGSRQANSSAIDIGFSNSPKVYM
jgi:hypothetical protein